MQRYWPILYITMFILAAMGGAGAFGQNFEKTNVDWVFIAISFFSLLAFPPLIVSFALGRNPKVLLRASFWRGFRGGWRVDPLQLLRVSILLLGGLVLGSLRSLPEASPQSNMLMLWQAGMLLGLVLGERIVYVLFRSKIA
jgi:hypothetical protein